MSNSAKDELIAATATEITALENALNAFLVLTPGVDDQLILALNRVSSMATILLEWDGTDVPEPVAP